MIRFVPFDLRHLRNNLSKHPPPSFQPISKNHPPKLSKFENSRRFLFENIPSLFFLLSPSPFFFFYSAPFFVSMRKSRLLLCWNGSKFRCLRNGGPAGGEKKSKKDLGRDRWRTVSRNISNACCCLVTNTVSPSMFNVLCCAGRGDIVI